MPMAQYLRLHPLTEPLRQQRYHSGLHSGPGLAGPDARSANDGYSQYPTSTSFVNTTHPGFASLQVSFIMRGVTATTAESPTHVGRYSATSPEIGPLSPRFPTSKDIFSKSSASLPRSPRTYPHRPPMTGAKSASFNPQTQARQPMTGAKSASFSTEMPARQNPFVSRSVSPTVKGHSCSPIFGMHGWEMPQNASSFLSSGHPNLVTHEHSRHAAHANCFPRHMDNLGMFSHCMLCGMALATSPGALSRDPSPSRSLLQRKIIRCSSLSVPHLIQAR